MDEEEKWNKLLMSIRKAAHILNIDLTEEDMPQPSDWKYATQLNRDLWNRVYLKRRYNGLET